MIQKIPADTATVNAEGPHIAGALTTAAAELGVAPGSVQFTIDTEWFRNSVGGATPRDTVKIIAWVGEPSQARPERRPEPRSEGRSESRSEPAPRESAPPLVASEEESAQDAQKWLQGLVGHMGFEGTVVATMNGGSTIVLNVDLKDRTPHFVGRRGITLQGIRHLLEQSVGADYPDHSFQIDVVDKRPRRDDDRGPRSRDRDDRGRGRDRDDRGRGRDRDDRGRGRGRSRDRDDRGRGGDEENAARLTKMAANIAKRVAETGEAEVVRKELNSFDRRVVHMAISEVDGVGSRSLGDGNYKQVEIFREEGGESSASGGEE